MSAVCWVEAELFVNASHRDSVTRPPSTRSRPLLLLSSSQDPSGGPARQGEGRSSEGSLFALLEMTTSVRPQVPPSPCRFARPVTVGLGRPR